MKNIAKKAAESVITLAKTNVKDDINSTGSPWSYQHIGRLFPCHSPKVTAISKTSANIASL